MKGAQFVDVCKRMISPEDDGTERARTVGGNCCGGDLSPEAKIEDLVPRLNEVIFDTLASKPFNGNNFIDTE